MHNSQAWESKRPLLREKEREREEVDVDSHVPLTTSGVANKVGPESATSIDSIHHVCIQEQNTSSKRC
jgi:hypothetical protein